MMAFKRPRKRCWPSVQNALCIKLIWKGAEGRCGCWTEDGEDAPGVVQIILERVVPPNDGAELGLEIVYTFSALSYRGTTPPGGPDPDDFVTEDYKLVRVLLKDLNAPEASSAITLAQDQQASIWMAYAERIEAREAEVPDDP